MRTAVAVFNFLRVEHYSGKSATHTDYKMSVSCKYVRKLRSMAVLMESPRRPHRKAR